MQKFKAKDVIDINNTWSQVVMLKLDSLLQFLLFSIKYRKLYCFGYRIKQEKETQKLIIFGNKEILSFKFRTNDTDRIINKKGIYVNILIFSNLKQIFFNFLDFSEKKTSIQKETQ